MQTRNYDLVYQFSRRKHNINLYILLFFFLIWRVKLIYNIYFWKANLYNKNRILILNKINKICDLYLFLFF